MQAALINLQSLRPSAEESSPISRSFASRAAIAHLLSRIMGHRVPPGAL